jgi:hypothetical protein
MAFPTSLDELANVADGVDYPEAAHINNLNDAVEALEAKVGVDDSAVATSIDYIIKNQIWPVGAVFISVVDTDPATLIGFGTWEQVAEGQMIVGQKDTDTDFNVAEETGGAKTATLAMTNMPSHDHTGSSIAGEAGHRHSVGGDNIIGNSSGHWAYGSGTVSGADISKTAVTSGAGTNHTHSLTVASQGSGTAFSIVNPYFVCYIWKRTA